VFGSAAKRIDSSRIEFDRIDSARIEFDKIDLCLDNIKIKVIFIILCCLDDLHQNCF
jgi:hypothetical protein